MINNMSKDRFFDNVAVITDVCEYFTEYPESISSKVKNEFTLHRDGINFCIVLRLIQKCVYKNQKLAIVIAKYHDIKHSDLQTFKILIEVDLDPVENAKNFRLDKRPIEEIRKEVNERIENEGSFNQMICFTCKDEKMRGPGYYSVLVCNATEDEIKANHDLLRTECVDDCPFTVVT